MDVDGVQDYKTTISSASRILPTIPQTQGVTVDSVEYEMESEPPPSSSSSLKWRSSSADNATGETMAFVDDRFAIDRPFNMNERFVTVLDQLDTTVEKLRKDALGLQEKRDFLLMSIDLIKHNEMLHGMEECDREEINCYIKRVSTRLSTIELNVKTVRDKDQEESLCQVNTMIDSLIINNDPVMSRQRCQSFLNACSGSDFQPFDESCNSSYYASGPSTDLGGIGSGSNSGGGGGGSGGTPTLLHDKKFESAILGCTLDDQKNIKRRLLALMSYLNQQTISD